MRMIIKQNVVKELIESYYKEQYDLDGKAEISLSKCFAGGPYEYDSCILQPKLISHITVLGKNQEVSIDIPVDQVIEIVKYYLEKEGHNVKKVFFNKGINQKPEGIGVMERIVDQPYFEGVNVEIKDKVNKIGGIKNEN